ncbi:hypothetical protein [Microcoleus sp. FACHB-SPT15]|nr:hypothetical protein [Microcoleus sp. FACHB-SPT15]
MFPRAITVPEEFCVAFATLAIALIQGSSESRYCPNAGTLSSD